MCLSPHDSHGGDVFPCLIGAWVGRNLFLGTQLYQPRGYANLPLTLSRRTQGHTANSHGAPLFPRSPLHTAASLFHIPYTRSHRRRNPAER